MLMVPAMASPDGRWPDTKATPSGASSLTRSTNCTEPRSFSSSTASPSDSPRAAASSGWSTQAGGPSRRRSAGDARERGVALVVARRGEEAQGPAAGFLLAHGIGHPVGHRGQALTLERLGIELELARRRREALRRRRGQLDRAGRAQRGRDRRRPPSPWRRRRAGARARPCPSRTRDRRDRAAAPVPAPAADSTTPRRAAARPRARTGRSTCRTSAPRPRSRGRWRRAARCPRSARCPTGTGSWTTVNRSSRESPRRTVRTSGHVTAGLFAATKSPRIRGRSRCKRASPRREWFTRRVSAGPEGFRIGAVSSPNDVAVIKRAPPPRRSYAPTTPGRSATARMAWPPWEDRDIPSPSRMKGARARPYRCASRSTSAAGTPVIAATRAGSKRGSTSRSRRSNPSVFRAR